MLTLISVAELKQLLAGPGCRLFDCRFSLQNPAAGLRAWEKGHIPGAMFADLNNDLSAPPVSGKTGRHPLPERSTWIRKVLNWGLDPEVDVVVYDDSGAAGAARMWWMLGWIGHARVRVLDGGLQAWTAAGGELVHTSTKAVPAAADHYSALPSLTRLMSTEDIDPDIQFLIDARDPPRFRAAVEPIDPVAGHIPGAHCFPYMANLAADGRFKPVQELRERFGELQHSFLRPVCYCGSGVTACQNILAIVHAGLHMPDLYAGSWSEWITDPARPVATGD
jgi:thiosulfate/3-mercaptopyruvate sulfurtransferase